MTTTLGLLFTLLLHPVHETVSEIEWNPTTGRLEVALRMSILDEQWIEQQMKTTAAVKTWAPLYLASRFRIASHGRDDADPKKRAATYHWVGREEQGSHVWWYFEIQPAQKARPKVISQRMLLERNEGYVNRVVVLGDKTRRAVTLTVTNPQADLQELSRNSASSQ